MNLMLHCGAEVKERDEVFAVPVPEQTDTYLPLPYESFVTRVEKQLSAEGIIIREEKLALAKQGQRLFGLLNLDMPGSTLADYGCVLGLRNSYDKSFKTGVCIGASVFVCDNLSFHGDVTFERKHTANLFRDLSWMLTETISQLPVKFARQSRAFEHYRQTSWNDERAHHVVIRLLDAGALNVTHIPHILKEWRTPRHAEFARDGKTTWRLFNACTEILKGDIWRLPVRTKRIHEVLDAETRNPEPESECPLAEETCIVA